ncbi:hypothetical protein LOK49_LG12G01048 [Camellia lanceoleosa]|uniref:Uncharacterized protein n=1 Tax=Camellia lanceoleosa TaxID=1840588 RepID=A0ACC0FVG3_9ERIC|nr:hypothetical protein LOK49_LG12G01048 [Camellia lanceoleosa]
MCNLNMGSILLQVLILQDSVEEKDDEITRLKQELQHRSIVEEEKTEVASDKKDGDIDGGMLCPEAETESHQFMGFRYNQRTSWKASARTPRTPPQSHRASAWSATTEAQAGGEYRYRNPWEEIAADKSFEEAGFAAALAADDGDLSDLDRGLATELSKDVLKLVDDWGSQVAQRSSI